MKFRESGMPDENMWDTFFNPSDILRKMDVNETVKVLIDIGCGYGTFLVPAARIIKEKAIGIDIEEEMINTCLRKCRKGKLKKLDLVLGDVTSEKTNSDLKQYIGKVDYVTLFNILHCEAPLELLAAAYYLLKPKGKIGVIHWNYEDTPRGPSMDIRPTAERITEWALQEGFHLVKQEDLKPYHYGLVFQK